MKKRAKRHQELVKREQRIKSQNRQYSGSKSPYHFIGRVKHDAGFELIRGHKNRSGFRWRNYWSSYLKRMTSDGNK